MCYKQKCKVVSLHLAHPVVCTPMTYTFVILHIVYSQSCNFLLQIDRCRRNWICCCRRFSTSASRQQVGNLCRPIKLLSPR